MTAPMVADLETGAAESTSLESTSDDTHSLSSLLDDALDSEPSIAAEEGETPEQTKARIDRGDGRDVTGKFVVKEPPPPKVGEAPPAAPNAEQTPAAPTKAPFRYRALGKTNDVPESEISEDGRIWFASTQHGRLAQAFNALEVLNGQVGPVIEKHKQENVRLTRELEEAKGSSTARDTQAGKLVDFFTAIANEPDDEKALAAMWDLRKNFPHLVATAERDHWKKEAERRAALSAPSAPAAVESKNSNGMPPVDEVRAFATEHLEQWKISPEHRGIPAEAWKHAEDRVTANPIAFLRQATADDAKTHPGVTEGEVVFDRDLLYAEVDAFAKRDSAARETAAAQTKLAAKNAVRTQATITAPPSAGGTQPPPKSGTQRFKTKEEYEAWKASDDIDDD